MYQKFSRKFREMSGKFPRNLQEIFAEDGGNFEKIENNVIWTICDLQKNYLKKLRNFFSQESIISMKFRGKLTISVVITNPHDNREE